MSRTAGSAAGQFAQLLLYVTEPEKLQQADHTERSSFGSLLGYFAKPDSGVAVLHNLRTHSEDLSTILAEFERNARYLSKRKNGVVLYHEVLSFHAKDKNHLQPEVLHDLAKTWLAFRAPNALAFAKPHFDQDHVHIHLVISANNLGSAKKLRLSRTQFAQAKLKMELYQREKHPELAHSQIDHHAPSRKKARSEKENQRQRRLSQADMSSEKEVAKGLLLRGFTEQTSQDQLDSFLAANGFKFYQRGQKTFGVEALSSGRKYRIKTLGLWDAFNQARQRWAQVPQRVHELDQISVEKQRLEWREMGFSQRMLAVAELLDRAKHRTKQHLRLAGRKMRRRFNDPER